MSFNAELRDKNNNIRVGKARSRILLSVIIVNFNTKELLKKCLDALFINRSKIDFEVLVVDNSSTDGSLAMIKNNYPSVFLIANKANVGFAKANNQAIRISNGKYLILLNSDVVIAKNTLNMMIDFMEQKPAVGAAGVKLINPDGSRQRLSRGYFPTLKTSFNQFLLFSNLFPRSYFFRGISLEVDWEKEEEVDWVSAACVVLRKSVLEKVGLLNEDYFMYVEDIDICRRIKKENFKVFSLPLEVIHYHGSSSVNSEFKMARMWFNNLHNFILEENNRLKTALFDLIAFAGFMIRMSFFALYFLWTRNRDSRVRSTINRRLVKESVKLFYRDTLG